MKIIESIDELSQLLRKETIVLTYFGNERCSVCHATKPKVESLLINFPWVVSCYCPTDLVPQVAGQHLVFAVPAVIIFFQGKEIYRSARFIEFNRIVEILKELSEEKKES